MPRRRENRVQWREDPRVAHRFLAASQRRPLSPRRLSASSSSVLANPNTAEGTSPDSQCPAPSTTAKADSGGVDTLASGSGVSGAEANPCRLSARSLGVCWAEKGVGTAHTNAHANMVWPPGLPALDPSSTSSRCSCTWDANTKKANALRATVRPHSHSLRRRRAGGAPKKMRESRAPRAAVPVAGRNKVFAVAGALAGAAGQVHIPGSASAESARPRAGWRVTSRAGGPRGRLGGSAGVSSAAVPARFGPETGADPGDPEDPEGVVPGAGELAGGAEEAGGPRHRVGAEGRGRRREGGRSAGTTKRQTMPGVGPKLLGMGDLAFAAIGVDALAQRCRREGIRRRRHSRYDLARRGCVGLWIPTWSLLALHEKTVNPRHVRKDGSPNGRGPLGVTALRFSFGLHFTPPPPNITFRPLSQGDGSVRLRR